jgi:hypothetical protein
MQRFVAWLTASRLRVILGAAMFATLGFATLCVWVPGALIVLLALRGGRPIADWQAALVAGLVSGWWLVSAGAGAVPAALVAAGLIVPPLLVGRLLARGGSLSLAFQLSTLAALGLLAVVHLALADPPAIWQPLLERFGADLDRVAMLMVGADGEHRPADAQLRAARAQLINWGVAAALLLINTVLAAALGLYAHGRQQQTATLGPQFRALRAGRTLAVAGLVLALGAVGLHWGFALDAEQVFVGAFVLQGLALLHSAREVLGFGTGWLVATYALLFFPVTALFVHTALLVGGLLDNWLPFRARLALQAAKNKERRG